MPDFLLAQPPSPKGFKRLFRIHDGAYCKVMEVAVESSQAESFATCLDEAGLFYQRHPEALPYVESDQS